MGHVSLTFISLSIYLHFEVASHNKVLCVILLNQLDLHVAILSGLSSVVREVFGAITWNLMHQGDDHSNVLLMHKLPEVSQSGVYGPLSRNDQIVLCALMVNRLYAIRIDVAQIGLVGLRAKHNRSLLIRMHIRVYVHVLEIGDHLFRRQLVE